MTNDFNIIPPDSDSTKLITYSDSGARFQTQLPLALSWLTVSGYRDPDVLFSDDSQYLDFPAGAHQTAMYIQTRDRYSGLSITLVSGSISILVHLSEYFSDPNPALIAAPYTVSGEAGEQNIYSATYYQDAPENPYSYWMPLNTPGTYKVAFPQPLVGNIMFVTHSGSAPYRISQILPRKSVQAYDIEVNAIKAYHVSASLIDTIALQVSDSIVVGPDLIGAKSIDGSKIIDGTISGVLIQNGTVTGNKILAGTISGVLLQGETITGDKIAANTIDASKVTTTFIDTVSAQVTNSLVVGSGQIADKSIDGSKIVDGTVSGVLIRDGTVTGNKILAGTISGVLIAGQTITADNIASNAITAAKISAGTITFDKLASKTLTADQIADYTLTGSKIVLGSISGVLITDNAVTASKIAANTITGDKIVANTISGVLIAGETIEASNIKTRTITADRIVLSGITANLLGPEAVTAAALASESVISGKLGVGSVLANNIIAGVIQGYHVAADTITGANIQAATISGSRIAAGTIDATNIATNAITAEKIQAGVITFDKIATKTLTADQIADATLTGAKIVAGTVSGVLITDNSITASNIAAGTITGDKIQANTISGSLITAGTITSTQIDTATILASNIKAGTITADRIATGTLTATQIADATLTGAKIAAGTVSGVLIADNTIAATNILGNTITGDKIAANTITAGKLSVSQLDAVAANMGNLTVNSGITVGTNGYISVPSGYISAGKAKLDSTGLQIGNVSSSNLPSVTDTLRVAGSGTVGNIVGMALYNGAFSATSPQAVIQLDSTNALEIEMRTASGIMNFNFPETTAVNTPGQAAIYDGSLSLRRALSLTSAAKPGGIYGYDGAGNKRYELSADQLLFNDGTNNKLVMDAATGNIGADGDIEGWNIMALNALTAYTNFNSSWVGSDYVVKIDSNGKFTSTHMGYATIRRTTTQSITTAGTTIIWNAYGSSPTRSNNVTYSTDTITIANAGYYAMSATFATVDNLTSLRMSLTRGTVNYVSTLHGAGLSTGGGYIFNFNIMFWATANSTYKITLVPSANTTLNANNEGFAGPSPIINIVQLIGV